MSRSVDVLQVDAFTSRPFTGNPAGVVLDAAALSDAEMRGIAAEMNVAETAFVTPAARAGFDHGLRWFTPSGNEVTFCGHATVATVHALHETNRVLGDRVVFDTLGGRLPVAVAPASGGVVVWLEPALPACRPYEPELRPILGALGVVPDALGAWARPALTPERDLLVPMAGFGVLKSIVPDAARLARLGRDGQLRGFCCVARETVEPESLTHSRFFAPHYGIPEDPVTGSVHASLAVWLWEAGVLQATAGIAAFQGEQGDGLGRPGRLAVELRLDGGLARSVRVGGRAVTVLAGTIRVA